MSIKTKTKKIMCTWLGETPDELYKEIIKEPIIKINDDFAFCEKWDKDYLKERYGLTFTDCANGLFTMFCDKHNITNILDFDLMFKDSVNFHEYAYDLFEKDFCKWLDYMGEVFFSDRKYILENYEECEKNYYKFLEFAAGKMNERENASL